MENDTPPDISTVMNLLDYMGDHGRIRLWDKEKIRPYLRDTVYRYLLDDLAHIGTSDSPFEDSLKDMPEDVILNNDVMSDGHKLAIMLDRMGLGRYDMKILTRNADEAISHARLTQREEYFISLLERYRQFLTSQYKDGEK